MGNEEFEPYEMRLWGSVERVIEDFYFLDGSSRQVTYYEGICGLDDHGLYMLNIDAIDDGVFYGKFSEKGSEMWVRSDRSAYPFVLPAYKTATTHRESVPYTEIVDTEEYVVFVEATTADRAKNLELKIDSGLRMVEAGDFEEQDVDEQAPVVTEEYWKAHL